MEQKKTKEEQRIEALCDQGHFSTTVVYWKAYKILSRYRDIRHLPAMITRDEDAIREKAMGLIRDKFHTCYVEGKCETTRSIDHILSDFLSLEFADRVIEMVFDRMQRMNFTVEEYRPIIEYNFIYPEQLPDDQIQYEIGMSRSSYYRKKKDAIVLFGILLWNVMLEYCCLATPI